MCAKTWSLDFAGNTGLHFLFAYGYADIAEYFIEKARCRTLVLLLALVERTCGVNVMVRQGADDTVANETGKTAREGIR